MRVIFGAILGGVALFMWGFAYWVILAMLVMPPIPMADEPAFTEAMEENLTETGVYWIPSMPIPDATTDLATAEQMTEEWTSRYEAGPLALVIYRAEGGDPADPMRLVRGFIIDIVSALLASILLASACRGWGYVSRLIFLFAIGLLVSSSVHLIGWNFMFSPMNWALLRIGDSVGSWFVAGLVIAAVVKRKVSSDPVYI